MATERSQRSLMAIRIAQKIVSKSENRYVDLAAILPSARAEELAGITGKDARHIEVVLAESAEVLRARKNVIIVAHRLGYVMANAGIDESNITHVDGPGQCWHRHGRAERGFPRSDG